jgi:2-amino-4-hydroxy-6-hydroxymethyldihydropteridine diphosphokinase
MSIAYLGVGSNVGDRRAAIDLACSQLALLPNTRVLRVSGLIETEPVGMADKGRFLNGAIEVETSLTPGALLAALLAIEEKAGRLPPGQRIKWGPRTLDLDILLFDDIVLKAEGLTIPHPHMHMRWFVLKPLAELVPDKHHPLLHKTMAELLAGVKP